MSFARRTQRQFLALAFVVLAVVAGTLLTPNPAHADTFEVCSSGCTYDSIGAALAAAAGTGAGDTITLASGTYLESALEISEEIEIVGADDDATVIDGEDEASLFLVDGAGALTLRNLTVRGGSAEAGSGGGVQSIGIVDAQHVTFEDNDADVSGGAISQTGGGLTLTDVTFKGNTAPGAGAIEAQGADTTITRALFGTTTDTVRLDSGSIIYSSFPAGDEMLTATGASTVFGTYNWWGHESGPTHPDLPTGSGATVDGDVSFDPWLERVEVKPSATDLTIGETVSIEASVLDSEGTAVELLDLPLSLSVSGVNAHDPTSTDGAYDYAGEDAGTDTVIAAPLFGGENSGASSLVGSATVRWRVAPIEDDDDESSPPQSTSQLTAQEKFEALSQLGLFQGDLELPAVIDALDRAQLAVIVTRLLAVGGQGSQVGLGLPTETAPPAWSQYIAAMRTRIPGFPPASVDPDAGLMTVQDSETFLQAALPEPETVLQLLGFVDGPANAPYAAPWGFVGDFSGAFQALAETYSQAPDDLFGPSSAFLPIEAEGVASDGAQPGGELSSVTIEIDAGDLPAGVRPEQITLARLDAEGLRWVPVESFVTPLADGAFGLIALIDRSGYYNVIVRPVAEQAIHSGITYLVWFGADGQPPARALFGADADITALWAQDESGRWVTYRAGAFAFTQTLQELRDGMPLLVVSSEGGSWVLPIGSERVEAAKSEAGG